MNKNLRGRRLAGGTLGSLALLATIGVEAQTPPAYTIEDLGLLAGHDSSNALAINNRGQVLGYSMPDAGSIVPRGVVWDAGSTTPIDFASRVGQQVGTTEAGGINDAGHLTIVAGFTSADSSLGSTAHYWNGTTLTNIGKIGATAPQSGGASVGHSVNNADEVVGRSAVPMVPASAGATNKPFHWRAGVLRQLALPAGCVGGIAFDVNDNGQIAGTVFGNGSCNAGLAAVWPSATAAPLTINDVLASVGISADVRVAYGINDSGAVRAQARINDRTRCVLFTPPPGAAMVDLGYVGASEPDTCLPGSVNNRGEAALTQYHVNNPKALLCSNGVLYDLESLLDSGSQNRWQLLSAKAINDAGTVVGQGRINGQLHAYRATRVTSPGGSITVEDSIAPYDDHCLPFGIVTIGVGTIGTVTVHNGSDTPAGIDITVMPAAPFGIADPQDCRVTRAPGTSCTITVTFDPTSTAAVTGSFTLSLAGVPQVVDLEGTGRRPVLTITDSIAPADDRIVAFGGTVPVGSRGTATVTARNSDNTAATVALTRNLPPDVPFRMQDPAACNVILAPDQACSLVVIFEPVAAGDYSATFAIGTDASSEQTVTVRGSPGLPNADLNLTQVVDRAILRPGVAGSDVARITLTVRNNGPDGGVVTVSDVLPSGLVLLGSLASNGVYDGSIGNWVVGALAGGETATLALDVQATAAAAGCLANTASASVASPAVDPRNENNSATLHLAAPSCADLEIVASSIGDQLSVDGTSSWTHTVTIRNNGPSTATQVAVTAPTYRFSNGRDASNRVRMDIGDLAPGATAQAVLYGSRFWNIVRSDVNVEWTAVVTAAEPDWASDNDQKSGGFVIAGLDEPTNWCFIATAAYGSHLEPEVLVLRGFRDRVLQRSSWGRAFIAWYYRVSPPVADWIRHREWARAATRAALTPVIMGVKYPGPSGMLLALLCLGLLRWRRASLA